MTAAIKVLVLDDSANIQAFLKSSFPKAKTEIVRASTPEDAIAQAAKENPALAFIDGDDPERAEALKALKTSSPSMKIVVLSGGENTDSLIDLWFSHTAPDVTAARPINSEFLTTQLADVFGGEQKKAKPTPTVEPAASASAGESQLVKALSDQIAALDEELKTLRGQAASAADDGAIEEAVASAKAEAQKGRNFSANSS